MTVPPSPSPRPAVTNVSAAPAFSTMYATSRGWSLALIGTAARPACQQAKRTST